MVQITPVDIVPLLSREGLKNFLKSRKIDNPDELINFLHACKTPESMLGLSDYIAELFGFDVEGEYWKYKNRSVVKATANHNYALAKPELQIMFKLVFDNAETVSTLKQLFTILKELDRPTPAPTPAPKVSDCPICEALSQTVAPTKTEIPKAETEQDWAAKQTVKLPAAPSIIDISRNASLPAIPVSDAEAAQSTVEITDPPNLKDVKIIVIPDAEWKAERRHFLIPVKNFDGGFGMRIIQKSILHCNWGFDDRTDKRLKVRPGDKVCFYLTKDGVVAQGELGEKLDAPYKPLPSSGDYYYPNRYKLNGALLGQVVKVQDVIERLDFFRDHKVKRYGLIAKEVRLITEHDYNVLTGTEIVKSPLATGVLAR